MTETPASMLPIAARMAGGVRNVVLRVLPEHRYLQIARWWQYLRNIGFKHQCPICLKRIRRFIPHGTHNRQNAKCPFCESLERHRSLWLYLEHRTDLFAAEQTLLHFAPEPSLLPKLSKIAKLHYITTDLNPKRVDVALDIQSIPFSGSSFDVVLCCHVLEHVYDDRAAMAEIFRILKPGGWAIVQVPVGYDRDETFEDKNVKCAAERHRAFGQQDHLRLYGQRDYASRLADAGFSVQFDDWPTYLPSATVQKYGLSTQSVFRVRKPDSAGGNWTPGHESSSHRQ